MNQKILDRPLQIGVYGSRAVTPASPALAAPIGFPGNAVIDDTDVLQTTGYQQSGLIGANLDNDFYGCGSIQRAVSTNPGGSPDYRAYSIHPGFPLSAKKVEPLNPTEIKLLYHSPYPDLGLLGPDMAYIAALRGELIPFTSCIATLHKPRALNISFVTCPDDVLPTGSVSWGKERAIVSDIQRMIGDQAYQRFQEIQKLKAGWDFGVGEDFNQKVVSNLQKLAETFRFPLAQDRLRIYPNHEGGVDLHWKDSTGHLFILEVLPDRFGYYSQADEREGEVSLDDINKLASVLHLNFTKLA